MQFFTAVAVAVAVALTALTATISAHTVNPRNAPCLTLATTKYLVNGFASLLTAPQGPNFNSTAKSILASDFTDKSDSINWLAGIPLGSTTFPSRSAFIGGQGSQPPIGFTVLETMFSCSEVSFRWKAIVGSEKWPVKGINFFSTSNLNGTQSGFQIKKNYSEFNVGAWEVDIGRTCSAQGANV